MKWLDTDVIKAFGYEIWRCLFTATCKGKVNKGKIIRTGNEIMTVMNKI